MAPRSLKTLFTSFEKPLFSVAEIHPIHFTAYHNLSIANAKPVHIKCTGFIDLIQIC